jgi:alkyl sulfatase BDS1-like metallo-beta-lactamase superfamily hydrolase
MSIKISLFHKAALLACSFVPLAVFSQSKPASEFTQKVNKEFYQKLNFADSADFADARRGFIATLDSGLIRNSKGELVVNTNEYAFIKGEAPSTVNPSLWRQAQLNNINGLFKVADGIYQVRSFDIAVITFIRTNTGYLVIDPCTNQAAARAAYNLVKKHVGDFPVVAVISTHSHADHFGGVEGVVDAADIQSGKVKYITPEHFYQEAVSENVLLGNAMIRRAGYQFGASLPSNATGKVDAGLGKSYLGAKGGSSLLQPNIEIKKDGETLNIDGLDIEFLLAPDTEAPAELYFYIPKYRAFCPAENANRTFHNLLTPRGAKIRDAKGWSEYLNEAIERFGDKTDLVFLVHGWPIVGHDKSIDFLEKQRDLYKYVHDQTIHLANKGLNADEIAETIQLPKELASEWYNRDYYGTLKHNSKAVYQYYLGWWDGNPANYDKLPEPESAKRYVEFMGGEKAVVAKARLSYAKGEYRWVAEVLKQVVFANPANREARNLQADAFEQIAYQTESSIWRNIFLTGATELRAEGNVSDKPVPAGALQTAGQLANNLSVESLFDYLSVGIDGKKTEGVNISIRFIFPDVNKNLLVTVKNGVLHYTAAKPDVEAELTLTIPRQTLLKGFANPDELRSKIIAKDGISYDGNIFLLRDFFNLIDPPKANWNIVTP